MIYEIENRNNIISAATPFTGLSPVPHLHTHLEMIYLSEGASMATLDYKDFLLEEGDLFLAFPNQIHFYHDMLPSRGTLIIFANDFCKELKELFQTRIPISPVIKSELLPADIQTKLNLILEQACSKEPFAHLAAQGYLLALLCELLRRMSLIPSPHSYDSIKNILNFCSERYTEPLSLDILSRELHLNKYYISHLFKERMKISFTDFINEMRVEYACSLLKQNSNITEAAFTSGFCSVRTFNRAFSKVMKTTPREYIRESHK